MYRLIAILIGYAFGCIQNGFFLSKKVAGIDIRDYGSGSAGMTNVMRVLGFRWGVIVLFADIAKAVLAFLLAAALLSCRCGDCLHPGLYAGAGVILGHNFPFYLRFRGGKGVASTLGLIFMLDWRVALIICGIMILTIAVVRYISVASLAMSLLIPVGLAAFGHNWEAVAITSALGALAWFMHRKNILRLFRGQEDKFLSKKGKAAASAPPRDPSEPSPFPANKGKTLEIAAHGENFMRIPVRTHVITNEDTLDSAFTVYLTPHVREGDYVFISERAVACTQARAVRMVDIKPRRLAVFMSRHVQKTPAGIGLGIPETMEMALRECGTLRILFAAAVSVIGKIFRRKGWFYIVAGTKARGIDGPCANTIPPYNEYVVLAPDRPAKAAIELSQKLCVHVIIVDCNDIGMNVLGTSHPRVREKFFAEILRDNPLGQSHEQTPCGIIRRIAAPCGG